MSEAQRNNRVPFHIDIQAIVNAFLNYLSRSKEERPQYNKARREYWEPYDSILKEAFGRGLPYSESDP